MKRVLVILISLLAMAGCATSDGIYKGRSNDKMYDSPCKDCNKIPFYVDTQWLVKR